MRQDLGTANRYAELARFTGQERGLSNGWLLQASGGIAPALTEVRQQLDRSLAQIQIHITTENQAPAVPPAISERASQLPTLRGQIDRREVGAQASFDFYSGLVDAVNDTAARRLAEGMVAVGLQYEHVNHLQRAAELFARVRGLTNGALRRTLRERSLRH